MRRNKKPFYAHSTCVPVRVCVYLPALVIIISVPISWKRFHRSAHCSSTWISSMEAGGEGSQGPGARSSGDPNEQEVLSARPSPSEPGLASESVEEKEGR